MTAQVVPLHPPHDQGEQLDRLAARHAEVLERRERLSREQIELERQFVENDLRVRSGTRQGEPLSRMGRVRRLERLLDVHHQGCLLDDEDSRLRGTYMAMRLRQYAALAEES